MQFSTQAGPKDQVSLTEYLQIALQSGTSLMALNNFRVQSEQLTNWKLAYLLHMQNQDLNKLHNLNLLKHVINSVRKMAHT